MAPPPLPLELAIFSPSDAIRAQSLGASRIEFNALGSYPSGGLTPPVASLAVLSPQLRIPLRVMIRPRGPPSDPSSPDFLYTQTELDVMRAAISDIKASGALNVSRGDGFVFGLLKKHQEDGKLAIDADICRELVQLAQPIPCVFHRAFDPIASYTPEECDSGLDTLIDCGFVALLTAGGDVGKYLDNLPRLERICAHAAGRIQIVAGGGVRHHNIAGPAVGFAMHGEDNVWVHSAALAEDGSGLDEDEVRNLLQQLRK